MFWRPPRSTLFPTRRSSDLVRASPAAGGRGRPRAGPPPHPPGRRGPAAGPARSARPARTAAPWTGGSGRGRPAGGQETGPLWTGRCDGAAGRGRSEPRGPRAGHRAVIARLHHRGAGSPDQTFRPTWVQSVLSNSEAPWFTMVSLTPQTWGVE